MPDPTPAAPADVTAERFAQQFHEAYERLAPEYGYTTRTESNVPWEYLREPNKALMIAVVTEVLASLLAEAEELRESLAKASSERGELRDRLDDIGISFHETLNKLVAAEAERDDWEAKAEQGWQGLVQCGDKLRQADEAIRGWNESAIMEAKRAEAAEAERDEARQIALAAKLDTTNARFALAAAERLCATQKEALERAVYLAEHLFAMIPRETWRASGGDDGQGHYEGDHRAEDIQSELAALRLGEPDPDDQPSIVILEGNGPDALPPLGEPE